MEHVLAARQTALKLTQALPWPPYEPCRQVKQLNVKQLKEFMNQKVGINQTICGAKDHIEGKQVYQQGILVALT